MTRAWIGVLLCIVFGITLAAAQTAPAVPPGIAELVTKQFGSCFELATRSSEVQVKYLHPDTKAEAPFIPFVTGDVDGDGVEDAVIVATCKNPLADGVEFGYKVIDPYYSAHGVGDPKITTSFGSTDPSGSNNVLLVIHGLGPDAWRSAIPKAKFVVINLPFRTVTMGRVQRKKGTAPAIKLVEAEDNSSVLYWDGKKYRWADVAGEN
jgi:hypothetical protein